MSAQKSLRLFSILMVAILSVLLMFAALGFAPPETPPGYRQVVIAGGTPVAADTNYDGQIGQGYAYLDMFYVIDQGTVNTASLELEVSYDAATFYNHTISPTLITANAADASGYVHSIPLHGYAWRIVANVANTNPLTITLKGVLR